MKRPISSLCAVAAASGAALLFALPAMAQTTNSDGYYVYSQNYDGTASPSSPAGTVGTPTGTTGGAGYAPVTPGQHVTLNAPRTADYDPSVPNTSTLTTAGTTETVGTTTFTNMAASGTGAENVSFQYTPTTPGPGFAGYTTASGLNQRPIVDLASTVSFDIYVASSTPGTVVVQLELEENNTQYENADGTTTFQNDPANAAAQPDILGMRGQDLSETDLWVDDGAAGIGTIGSPTPAGSSTSPNFPTGGIPVASGSWQVVTFNLGTDLQQLIVDSPATTGQRRSGLGTIEGIDFGAVSPTSGQAYSIYLDNMTIGGIAPAPEPSAWAGMGVGAALLLGLAVRARRRGAGLTAV